jgi:hypothetical protein
VRRQHGMAAFSRETNLSPCLSAGCNVALQLCRLGVGRLYILDYDVVQPSNLNRQTLFSSADIGRKKVYGSLFTKPTRTKSRFPCLCWVLPLPYCPLA